MENFSQVVVWPGCVVEDNELEDLKTFILTELGARIKYIETVITKPDYGDSEAGAGGRHDVLFYVHNEDIAKFAVKRFGIGARWVEDVLDNETRHNEENGVPEGYSIYPEHVKAYRTW